MDEAHKKHLKRLRNVRYRDKVKRDCIEHYGGCQCFIEGCPETNIDNLELHHVNGNGNIDRAEKLGLGLRSPGGWNFYVKIRKMGYPEELKVVCIKHHDKIHGRTEKDKRGRSSPGMDQLRFDDIVPF